MTRRDAWLPGAMAGIAVRLAAVMGLMLFASSAARAQEEEHAHLGIDRFGTFLSWAWTDHGRHGHELGADLDIGSIITPKLRLSVGLNYFHADIDRRNHLWRAGGWHLPRFQPARGGELRAVPHSIDSGRTWGPAWAFTFAAATSPTTSTMMHGCSAARSWAPICSAARRSRSRNRADIRSMRRHVAWRRSTWSGRSRASVSSSGSGSACRRPCARRM